MNEIMFTSPQHISSHVLSAHFPYCQRYLILPHSFLACKVCALLGRLPSRLFWLLILVVCIHLSLWFLRELACTSCATTGEESGHTGYQWLSNFLIKGERDKYKVWLTLGLRTKWCNQILKNPKQKTKYPFTRTCKLKQR